MKDELITTICPSCGETLPVINPNADFYCSFCGKKINIKDADKKTCSFKKEIKNIPYNDRELIIKNLVKTCENMLLMAGGIRVPKELFPYEESDYKTAENILRTAGFINVKLTHASYCCNPGMENIKVRSIKIDDILVNQPYLIFFRDSKVIIEY